MSSTPPTKRPRTAGGGPRLRVVVNVGGTQFETTLPTLQRSSMLASLVDVASWDDNPEHSEEIFLDRDPTVFGHVLRLMRAQPVFGGQLPKEDSLLCASILAEADYLGFEGLLTHVKARAMGNLRRAEFPSAPGWKRSQLESLRGRNDDGFFRPTEPKQWLSKLRESGVLYKYAFDRCVIVFERLGITEVWQLVVKLRDPAPTDAHGRPMLMDQHWELICGLAQMIEIKEEADAARAFELVHGSIAEALETGTVPTRYFESVRPKANLALPPSITQLMPVQAPTYFLIGDLWDNRYVQGDRQPGDDEHPFGGPMDYMEHPEGGPPNPLIEVDEGRDAMEPVAEWVKRPALVRRVACFALMEQRLSDGSSKKRLEPVLHLSTDDLQASLSNQPGEIYRYHTLRATYPTPTSGVLLEGAAERTMPASTYLEAICNDNGPAARALRVPACLWTHMLITDSPPAEIGFPPNPDPHGLNME